MNATIERYQVLLYVAALSLGAAAGLLAPGMTAPLERLVWPALALLLYATFYQVRPAEALTALRHRRFFGASLTANFVVVPLVAWGLSGLVPADPAVRLGFFLVLLVPCTDWFVTFSQLGGGQARLAVAIVPLLLLIQFALLPLYLWLFLGPDIQVVAAEPFLRAFLTLIVLPFALATLTRRWTGSHPAASAWLSTTAHLPIPLVAVVLLLIAASQAPALGDLVAGLGGVALAFVLYLLVAAPLARGVARVFRLETAAGRTLAFNIGTRNSFVVLPLALALPAGSETAVAVIVLQTVVELAGMVVYLWWVPTWLFPRTGDASQVQAR